MSDSSRKYSYKDRIIPLKLLRVRNYLFDKWNTVGYPLMKILLKSFFRTDQFLY